MVLLDGLTLTPLLAAKSFNRLLAALLVAAVAAAPRAVLPAAAALFGSLALCCRLLASQSRRSDRPLPPSSALSPSSTASLPGSAATHELEPPLSAGLAAALLLSQLTRSLGSAALPPGGTATEAALPLLAGDVALLLAAGRGRVGLAGACAADMEVVKSDMIGPRSLVRLLPQLSRTGS